MESPQNKCGIFATKIMGTLNEDVYYYIFYILSITDKRSFIRTCTHINRLSHHMPSIEHGFQKMLNDTKFLSNQYCSSLNYSLYKYTVELLYDERQVPDKYIIPMNGILHKFSKIYKMLAMRGNMTLISKMLNLNRAVKKNTEAVAKGAAKVGNIQILEQLYVDGHRFSPYVASSAAAGGQIETLKWLLQHQTFMDTTAIYRAGQNGHIQILKYITGCIGNVTVDASDFAARNGHLDVVKFFHHIRPNSLFHAANGAVIGGHLNIVIYAADLGAIPTSYYRCGNICILKWLHQNSLFNSSDNVIENVAASGNLECLQYLYSRGYDICRRKVFENAARNCNAETFQWLHSIGAVIDKSIVNIVLGRGLLDVIKMFVSWDYNLSKHNCMHAAQSGNLDMLRYQHSKGCSLDNIIEQAAMYGHLHVIIWCRKQGCEWNERTCHQAANANHLEVLKWLRGIDRDQWDLQSDETEICPWNKNIYVNMMHDYHIDTMMFAIENGCEMDEESFSTIFVHPEITECIRKRENM